MLKPPKSMCNQSIILKRSKGENLYGKAEYDDGIEIKNCVVHLRTIYSGSNNDRQIVANGTIILYKDITEPFLSLSKEDIAKKAKIVYEGTEYTITNINEDREPFNNDIYQYKIMFI